VPVAILLTFLNLSIFASTLISLTRTDVRMTTTRQVLQAAKEALNHIVSHLLQKDEQALWGFGGRCKFRTCDPCSL